MIHDDRFYKLELLILALLKHKDYTSCEITHLIQKLSQQTISIKEGIVFTKLYYYTDANLLSTYVKDNQTYYHINEAGLIRYDMLKRSYNDLIIAIDNILSTNH